jgi:phosphate-selective porin OprO/OprP
MPNGVVYVCIQQVPKKNTNWMLTMRKATSLAARPAVLAAVLASLWMAPPLRAQDATEERIRQLEDQLKSVLEQLRTLKEEVQRKPQPAAAAPTTSQPPATGDAALRNEIEQLKGQVAEVKEQAATNEAKLDQNGIRAYLGPGLVFEDPRGRWRLQVSGRAQTDFRAFSPDYSSADTFTLRRARIGVDATLLDYYRVFVEEEFANQATGPAANNAPIMTFAFADFNWFRPGLRFRVGQFKPFIGLDNTMLDLQTDFLERALTQSLFQNLTYDRGIMTLGEPVPGLFYSAALTNGTGQQVDEFQGNLREAQSDGKDVTVRVVGNFAQFLKVPDTVIHFGGTIKRGSAVNSKENPYRAATVQTEAKGLTFFIPAPFNTGTGTADVSNINRTIFDIEAALAYRGVKIQGDYVEARYAATTLSPTPQTDFERTLKAWYVTLGWMITGEYYSDIYREGTFVRPRPRNNLVLGEAGSWGLWELNFRYSYFDGSDFNNGNAANTGRLGTSSTFPNIQQGTNRAQAFSLGLKWQPNLYTRLMVNLIRTEFDTPVIVNKQSTSNENAVTLRAQVDF